MKKNRKGKRLLSMVAAIAVSVALAACGGQGKPPAPPEAPPQTPVPAETPAPPPSPAPTPTSAPGAQSPGPADGAGYAMYLDFSPGFGTAGKPYEPLDITPSVEAYSVAPGLANVENRGDMPWLTPGQVSKLEQNGFVVSPTDQEQLFYIYDDNDYRQIPSFITADSVLQAYHVFYNYALRTAEAEAFYGQLVTLNGNMLKRASEMCAEATDPEVKAQALLAAGYFAVPQLALGGELPEGFPEEIIPAAEAELALVLGAEGYAGSPLFGGRFMDYSLFTVRGHYTRSELLGRYFTAMSWYGLVPFEIIDADGNRNEGEAIMASLTTIALCSLAPGAGGKLWENIYSPTSFFVGNADDITPYQFAKAIEAVYGAEPDINALPGKIDELYREAEKLPRPRIVSKNMLDAKGLQIRFMGQRYIPDSEILQELCEPLKRPFPSGLDVLAIFGWERAAEHLEKYENPAALWPGYTGSFEAVKARFGALPEETWQSNLYYAWLYTLQSLKDTGEGYPMFMQNSAWADKSISTALASWAELRHDTILYGKASGAQMGGGEEEPVPAYVEPNAEVYNKLLWMTGFARENLAARGLLPEGIAARMLNFEELLAYLLDCSVRELRGEDLTDGDYARLRAYGGWLEYLTCSLASSDGEWGISHWYEIESDANRNMAVVADVHTAASRGTSDGFYLEEAVGTASEIYVVFPQNGKLYLGRGAVFDYYEFKSGSRLTDEEWQEIVKQSPPPRPEWTESFREG